MRREWWPRRVVKIRLHDLPSISACNGCGAAECFGCACGYPCRPQRSTRESLPRSRLVLWYTWTDLAGETHARSMSKKRAHQRQRALNRFGTHEVARQFSRFGPACCCRRPAGRALKAIAAHEWSVGGRVTCADCLEIVEAALLKAHGVPPLTPRDEDDPEPR